MTAHTAFSGLSVVIGPVFTTLSPLNAEATR